MVETQNPAVIIGTLAFVTAIANALVSYFVNYKPNKRIEKISRELNEFDYNNQEAHKSIISKLEEHSVTIDPYIKQQSINQRLTDIAKHAIDWTDKTEITLLIDILIGLLIDFVQDIIEIGLDNLSEEQLKIKLSSLKIDLTKQVREYLNKLDVEKVKELECLYNNYALAVMDIREDEINDKTSRLFIKTEDFAHTILKKSLKYFVEVLDEQSVK